VKYEFSKQLDSDVDRGCDRGIHRVTELCSDAEERAGWRKWWKVRSCGADLSHEEAPGH
jgi:hypothetical protein